MDMTRFMGVLKLFFLLQSLVESLPAPNKDSDFRFRRASGEYTVELLLVTDYSVFKYWSTHLNKYGQHLSSTTAEDLIKYYYAYLIDEMQYRYQSITSEPYRIKIRYNGIYVSQTATSSPWSTNHVSNGRLDASVVLNAFSEWINSNKGKLPPHDHAIGFTRFDIMKSENNITGFAFQDEICTTKSQSIVEESFNSIFHTIAAHELGHSLGAKHDNQQNSCQGNEYYIMDATNSAVGGSKALNPWQFSTCSKSEINSLLTTLIPKQSFLQPPSPFGGAVVPKNKSKKRSSSVNCLQVNSIVSSPPDIQTFLADPIGQIYDIHHQCILAMNHNQSFACLSNFNGNYNTLCSGLWCFNPRAANACQLIIPLKFTTCGNNKWCKEGRCISNSAAPVADETCLYGNYYNVDCSQIPQKPSLCYQAGTTSACCQSCKDVRTDVNGCEYGDRSDGCRQITSGASCYNGDTDVTCCNTCAKYRTQITNCEYGDRMNCSSITFGGDCYSTLSDGSKTRDMCCQTCRPFETNIPGCPFGDRILDCKVGECRIYEAANILTDCCGTCSSYLTTTASPKDSSSLPTWVIPAAASGGGGLLLIIILVVVCCCCRKSSSDRDVALKYRANARNPNYQKPAAHQVNQRNPDMRYKSEIRHPDNTYMGPIKSGGNDAHMYERPLPTPQQPTRPYQQQPQRQVTSGQQNQVSSGPQRQMSTKSHVYMELEPDEYLQRNDQYVVIGDHQYINPSFQK